MIDERTLIGQLFGKSRWFPSTPIERVELTSFKPTLDDLSKFGVRVSGMLGFPWIPWRSPFNDSDRLEIERCDMLKAAPRWQWLDDNAKSPWLPCMTTYIADDHRCHCDVRIWFQSEEDATLFALAL